MNFYNRKFVDYVKNECKTFGIKFKIDFNAPHFKHYDGTIVGYFDGENKELVVAGKNRQYISVLLHEYCHMLQFLEKPHIFNACDYEKLWQWISKYKVPFNIAEMNFIKYAYIERDVGKIGLPLIDAFSLRLNPDLWIKRHNVEITWTKMCFLYRSEGSQKVKCYPKNLIALMPTHFEYYPEFFLPKKIHDKFSKYFLEV